MQDLTPSLVHRLDGVGHMAHMERASEVNKLIETLIAAA